MALGLLSDERPRSAEEGGRRADAPEYRPPEASRIDLGRRERNHSVRDGCPAGRPRRPVRHRDAQGSPQNGARQAAGVGPASLGEGERGKTGLPPGHTGQRSGSQLVFRPGVRRSISVLVSDQETQLAASCGGMWTWGLRCDTYFTRYSVRGSAQDWSQSSRTQVVQPRTETYQAAVV